MKKRKATIKIPRGRFIEDTFGNIVRAAGHDYREWTESVMEDIEKAQAAIQATHAPFHPNDVAFSVTLMRVHRVLNEVAMR